jgi:Fe-S-cluster containining protein
VRVKIMDVNCSGCGYCCFSPINEIVVNHIKDTKTRELLNTELIRWIKIGVITKEVIRSGSVISKQEIRELLNAGLSYALSPHLIFIPPSSKNHLNAFLEKMGLKHIRNIFKHQKAWISLFKLRHIVMLYEADDGFKVPVFACAFFDPKENKCEIFGKSYRPTQCKVFPFNAICTSQIEIDHRKNPVIKRPMCDPWRLNGELTSQQKNEATQFENVRINFINCSYIPITEKDMGKIGASLNNLHLIMDHWRDLPILTNRVFLRLYGSEYVNSNLNEEESRFSEYIHQKIATNIEWWENIKLEKSEVFEISARMEEIFFSRIMTKRSIEFFSKKSWAR